MARRVMARMRRSATLEADSDSGGVCMAMPSVSLALALVLAAAPSTAPITSRGLLELADTGEVLLLPAHNRQPFDAWLFTRSAERCSAVEAAMLDVDTWVNRFDNIKSSKVTSRVDDVVRYELELTVVLAPTIYGKLTRVGPGALHFNDIHTKAFSVYELEDADDGTCLIRYRIVEEAGKSSGWVAIMKGLEARAGDAGNYAAALSSARGFAKPERARKVTGTTAEAARIALAGQGTMIEIDRSGRYPSYTLRRRVRQPFATASWAVRNKKGYSERCVVVKKSEDHGRTASYTIGGFGGRVSVITAVTEREEAGGVLVVDERVSGGDLEPGAGGWRWRIAPVAGGVDVELRFDADLVAGSRVMSAMADTDPIARESFMLHIALQFMADLIGGEPLPADAPRIALE